MTWRLRTSDYRSIKENALDTVRGLDRETLFVFIGSISKSTVRLLCTSLCQFMSLKMMRLIYL